MGINTFLSGRTPKEDGMPTPLYSRSIAGHPVKVYYSHVAFRDLRGRPHMIPFKRIGDIRIDSERQLANLKTVEGKDIDFRLPRDTHGFKEAIKKALAVSKASTFKINPRHSSPKSDYKPKTKLEERLSEIFDYYKPSDDDLFGDQK